MLITFRQLIIAMFRRNAYIFIVSRRLAYAFSQIKIYNLDAGFFILHFFTNNLHFHLF